MMNYKPYGEQWYQDEDERGGQVVAVLAFFAGLMILFIALVFGILFL